MFLLGLKIAGLTGFSKSDHISGDALGSSEGWQNNFMADGGIKRCRV